MITLANAKYHMGFMNQFSFRWGWTAAAILAALLAFVPIAAVMSAFFGVDSGGAQHIWSTVMPTYVVNTLILMGIVGIIATFFGVATAWIVTAMDFPGRRILSWLLPLPLAAPAYIIAYLYTDLLEFSGPIQTALRSVFNVSVASQFFPNIRSVPGAGVIMALVLYPYVYLLARASFAAQSRSQFLAARSLGMSPTEAFFRVVLPGARPAIAGGLALALMETLADFGVADYFAIPTLSTGIFRTWLAMGDRVAAMQIAGVMLLFVILLVAVEAISRRGRVTSNDRLSSGKPPLKLSFFQSAIAIGFCGIPVAIGFFIPVLVLGVYAAAQGDPQSFVQLAEYAWNSLRVALITAFVAVMIAVLLAYAQRIDNQTIGTRVRLPSVLLRGGVRVSTLGYALPGALLAVGLLAPLGALDRSLAIFLRDTFAINQGLILSGTIALLVYALVVRFLTVSYNSVSSGLEKISPSMDAAAQALGASRWRLLRQVHVPLLMPSLAAGGALVFVDVMRELPATLILRPFNFETLATRVYRLASDERIAEASSAALIIIVLGLLPIALLQRASRH